MTQTREHIDAAARRAERRQLTVMFCDLVGSTALSERFDPEDMRDLLTAYRQVCASAINRFGGFLARYIGDGILVYFGYPQAHEYDAEHSVRAGLEIVQNLSGLNEARLEVRIGIATGTVVVGDIVGEGTQEHDAVVGPAPNLASRLISLAEPGQIVVAESTHQFLLDLFECRDLGATNLKGFAEPVRAWHLLRESSVKSHSHAIHKRNHLTPLIAREDEVKRLRQCWEEAKEGKGQVVLVSGEAGIGKSRLIRHFKNQIIAANDLHSTIQVYCSDNYRNSELHPIIDHIMQEAAIRDSDSTHIKLTKVIRYIKAASPKSQQAVALILDLLSINYQEYYRSLDLSPDARKAETFRILEQYICEYAANNPALLIVEDLHWSDPTTLELLERVILNRVHDLPMLILLTFRAEFVPTWPDEHYITSIKIKRLSPGDSAKLLHAMQLSVPLSQDIIREIVEKSDRIPLFLEEVCKATIENLMSLKEKKRTAVMHFSNEGVPSSLAGSLMERLDRLGPVKGVAQVAAAVGPLFSRGILEDILLLSHGELDGALDRLARSEIIYARRVGAETTYVFKHALLRDAAYSSLLRGERKELHARIAQLLEEKYPETTRREPELLAHHCSKGGLAERAIDHWQKAGERARERSANSEAIGHISNGLELLKALPGDQVNVRREIDLRISLALALTALHGAGAAEVKENYRRARQLGRAKKSCTKYFTIMIGSWLNSFIGGDLGDADLLSNELLEFAERNSDVAYLVEAKRTRGMTLFYTGKFAQARSTIQSALELHDSKHHRLHAVRYGLDPLVCCYGYLAYASLFLGDAGEALCKSDEAVTSARALGHPYTYAFALAFAALVRQNLEKKKEARDFAKRAIQLSKANQFQFFVRQQLVIRAWADAQRGRTVEMRKAVDSFLDSGSIIGCTRILSLMAEVYIENGSTDEASTMLERALHIGNYSGEKFYMAEIHRLEAELCFVRWGEQAIAEICRHFHCSLDVSDDQNAVLWQLRTARSIACLGHKLCQQQEASNRLLKLCGGFKKGLDSAEVIRTSRYLLDELSPSSSHRGVSPMRTSRQ